MMEQCEHPATSPVAGLGVSAGAPGLSRETSRRQVLHTRMLVVEQSVGPSLASISLVVVLAAWFNRHAVPLAWLVPWTLAGLGVSAWRYSCARRLRQAPPVVAQADVMLRHMVWRAVPGGVFLAFTSWLYFRPNEPQTLLLLSVVPLLAFAGQVAATAPPVRVLVTLIAPGVVTLVALCLHSGTSLTYFLAAVVLLFSLALLRIARNIAQALDTQTRLTIENGALAAARDAQWHRAEVASEAKSQLFAAAGHDLRSPVHGLSLFLARFDDASLTPANQKLIGSVRESATGLLEMLDGVLDFSRADMAAITVHPTQVALQTLFDQVERDFGDIAHAKGLLLRCVASRVVVQTDAQLLARIVRNLVSNALRYTAKGGVLVGVRLRQGHWVLEVWDTGRGISLDEQTSVFNAFTRGVNAQINAPSGLGLGLAIARQFAQALGAELAVRSRPERGSVFRLTLPIA